MAKTNKIIATLRFFYCGKGDTILLQTSRGDGSELEWGLIDCHLTKVSGAYWRVRNVITRKDIRKLKFVCLTHPDRDHYFGMRELLEEHFYDKTADQIKVDEFWDSGVEFSLIAAIAERQGKKQIKAELDDLYRDFFARLIIKDKVAHCPMSMGMQAIEDFGDFHLLSLSPRINRVDRFNMQIVKNILSAEAADIEAQYEESNSLSVLLVLMHKTLPVNIILGGDATIDVWKDALAVWPRLCERLNEHQTMFKAVKVSHHGALTSQHPDLYGKHCLKGKTVAILSVGPDDQNHPHKNVLELLKNNGIKAYATCWPTDKPGRVRSDLLFLGSREAGIGDSIPKLDGYDCADVELLIGENGKICVRPREARIH